MNGKEEISQELLVCPNAVEFSYITECQRKTNKNKSNRDVNGLNIILCVKYTSDLCYIFYRL